MGPKATISEVGEEIVEEFNFFEDWMGRYEHLIDLGRSLSLIDNQYRTDDYRIRGCQAQVWLRASFQNGNIVFTADSDALITKGLVALLVRVLNNRKPIDVLNADLNFLDKIQMKEHLSPTRKNGLDAMIRQIRLYAVGFMQTSQAS
ncbi:MAG: SufE family protein [Bacteroidetes bacterium]|nr:MAG: SufE family protein [Bacteroidota bacterium]TDI76517.1 MAG: SufE family protein [Bacteroidota bacterium]